MSIRFVSFVSACLTLAGCGGGGGGGGPPIAPPPPPPGLTTTAAACVNGMAGDFPCNGISLESRVPPADMGGTAGNDLWGWVDTQTGKEYALMGLTNGAAFVDVSDPQNPVYLGRVDTQTIETVWRDIKVFADHAYIVADGAGNHGMQVFDLTRLRNVMNPQNFLPDMVYGDFGSAHNLAINEDSGFAYAVGSDTCGGGLHMIDLAMPSVPVFAGCHVADTHDTQCVDYQGPDPDYANQEICFSANEDRVEIVDVTIKSSPVSIIMFSYPELGFVHQGWLTEDHRFFLLGDELDEAQFGVGTRTHVIDVSDLDNPNYIGPHEAATPSIDHNLYVLGNRVFQANYSSGLRVLELTDLASAVLTEAAFFDTVPGNDVVDFVGAWSVYPYFPSGTIIVSDDANGLFIVKMQ